MDLSMLKEVGRLAFEAGQRILEIRAKGFEIVQKEDNSPVTSADKAAHEIIRRKLLSLTPDFVVISEEGENIHEVPSTPFWVVDPLDGTREFIKGRDTFTVNIALIEDKKPTMGVLYAPGRNLLFAALNNEVKAAYRGEGIEAFKPIHVRIMKKEAVDIVVPHDAQKKFAQKLTEQGYGINSISIIRGALKFIEVAEGRADIFTLHRESYEWDSGAGHAILEAAGGKVLTWNDDFTFGSPLSYGKPGFLNTPFVALGGGA